MNKAYIIDAVRTPIGRVGGALASVSVEHLLAPLIQALLQRNQLAPAAIDEVVIGNAAGPGGNPARVALLQAGLPVSIPGLTVDRQCGSGLEAINLAARLIQSGAASCVLAGGVESASLAGDRPRSRFAPAHIGDPDMGIAAENVARRFAISRERQDEFALRSHQRVVALQTAGAYRNEIVPIETGGLRVEQDECPRADCTREALARLPTVFDDKGTVTAGNACPVNDGAGLVLVVSEAFLTGPKAQAALQFVDALAAGVDPNFLGVGPVPAVASLLRRQQLTAEDIDLVEFNEAFAAQVLASMDLLRLPSQRVNPNGGALALGHPYGASGAILVTRLLHTPELGRYGLATLGIGGGLGLATLFRRV